MKTLIKLAKSNRRLPNLKNICAYEGFVVATNLDTWISTGRPANIDPGKLYYAEGFDFIPTDSGLPVANYPLPPVLGKVLADVEMTREDLDALGWVSLAMSKEEVRYYLKGICFDGRNEARILATDGHRLHLYKFSGTLPNGQYIVPDEAIDYILAIVKDCKKITTRFVFRENGLEFIAGGTTVLTRYIDGTYPDYTRVIPSDDAAAGVTSFDPAALKPVLKDMKVLAKIHGSRSLPVVLSCHGKIHCGISGAKDKEWPSETIISAKACPNGVGFNLRYLIECCGGELRYTDASSPIRIDGTDRVAVLMPLRV